MRLTDWESTLINISNICILAKTVCTAYLCSLHQGAIYQWLVSIQIHLVQVPQTYVWHHYRRRYQLLYHWQMQPKLHFSQENKLVHYIFRTLTQLTFLFCYAHSMAIQKIIQDDIRHQIELFLNMCNLKPSKRMYNQGYIYFNVKNQTHIS